MHIRRLDLGKHALAQIKLEDVYAMLKEEVEGVPIKRLGLDPST
jgi:hypothetical protein